MKLPIDDILKAVMKQLGNKGNQKARYDLLQKTKGIATTGSSKIGSKPKPKVTSKPKPKPKPKPKASGTVTGREVGKIARTTPPRPRRDYYAKGKSVPQTDSEKRAAEREANRMLRKSGFGPTNKPITGSAKPVDVRGSIIKPPSKATMRPPAPKGSSAFEADRSIAQIRADLAKYGLGQKKPKGKNK